MIWLIFATISLAIDCKKLGIEHLDRKFTFEQKVQTPPTETKDTIYFNPCSPVNVPECADDANYCAVSSINVNGNDIVINVKNYGSRSAGSKEEFTNNSPDDNEVAFNYEGAKWGERVLRGHVRVACGQGDTRFDDWEYGAELMIGDGVMCNESGGDDGNNDSDSDKNAPPKKSPKSSSGGWGFFHWLFFLIIMGAVVYALLTVYINFAQSRGNIPLAANIGDVLRDLPYLIRDVIRKVKAGFGGSTRSGYSAL